MSQPKLLIATRNPGKMREYRQLLHDSPYELVSLDDRGIAEEVEETGDTFEENARLKARTYGALAGILTLADDSGLEVDALGGEPGVFSSRYGGDPNATDRDRLELLLRNLERVPWEQRTARFRCVLAVATPPGPSSTHEDSVDARLVKEIPPRPPLEKGGWGDLVTLVGSVAGMIQYEPQGDEGFGYDPVFYLPSFGKTMGQLPLKEKNRISHRADAARKAVPVLQRLADGVKT